MKMVKGPKKKPSDDWLRAPGLFSWRILRGDLLAVCSFLMKGRAGIHLFSLPVTNDRT